MGDNPRPEVHIPNDTLKAKLGNQKTSFLKTLRKCIHK